MTQTQQDIRWNLNCETTPDVGDWITTGTGAPVFYITGRSLQSLKGTHYYYTRGTSLLTVVSQGTSTPKSAIHEAKVVIKSPLGKFIEYNSKKSPDPSVSVQTHRGRDVQTNKFDPLKWNWRKQGSLQEKPTIQLYHKTRILCTPPKERASTWLQPRNATTGFHTQPM